jgi:hypothetical protein
VGHEAFGHDPAVNREKWPKMKCSRAIGFIHQRFPDVYLAQLKQSLSDSRSAKNAQKSVGTVRD